MTQPAFSAASPEAPPGEPPPSGGLDVARVLARLAERHSCREFDGSPISREVIAAIVADGQEAPSSCNQQNWHFIVIDTPELKKRARAISGGNHHFEFCSAMIYLCFQKGWTHDKFSIVQSVAAACYHMMLSAHLRGFATIWNAGIGDTAQIAAMLHVPPTFEIQGALCIGRPKPTAPDIKPPRRPPQDVISWNAFSRAPRATYPAKPATSYPYFRIRNTNNPFAEWRPDRWGWERISDFRGYSVWAKSPIAGAFQSRRQGEATEVEIDLLPPLAAGARVVEVLPFGGTYTAALRRRLDAGVTIEATELSDHNIRFIFERLRQEGASTARVVPALMADGRLPQADASVDAVFAAQALEHTPEPERMLDEIRRVLRPGGCAMVSVRNLWSRYGWTYLRRQSRMMVAEQGPFRPLPAPRVRRLLAERFQIAREIGISLAPEADATVHEGPLRYACRLFAARVVKTP